MHSVDLLGRSFRIVLGLMILLTGLCLGESPSLSTGQTIYVPVYSHIYSGDREIPFDLAVTVSIRNTDPDRPLTLTSVRYANSEGKLVKVYLDKALTLPPLGSTRYVVQESDRAGGSGASFLIQWKSEQPVSEPIAESVMIGTRGQQGISFVSRGRVVREGESD